LLCGVDVHFYNTQTVTQVHHVVCNSIENDPDIQHLPIFALDKGMFGSFFSTYHQKVMSTGAIERFIVSYQHWLYYPVMALARFNLYVQSYLLILSNEHVDHHSLELGTLLFFSAWFTAMCTFCLSSWQERVCYLLLSHGAAGLLHVQITLSHFAEEVYHGQAYNDDSDEWFRMQCKTTLNVDCPRWMDWFHGGLQFQIEHHLFPRLPRHNLRACRDLVKAFCEKHEVPYNELPFIQGNMRIISKMYETAQVAKTLTKGDAGFYDCPLFNGAHALG
jgi:delta8-fatty-acid desaturase